MFYCPFGALQSQMTLWGKGEQGSGGAFAAGGSGAKRTLRRRSPESGFTRKEYDPSVSGRAANGWAVASAGQAEKEVHIIRHPYHRRAEGVAPYGVYLGV